MLLQRRFYTALKRKWIWGMGAGQEFLYRAGF